MKENIILLGRQVILEIWLNRFIIFQLAKRDFRNKYLGSYLGLPWAFIQPLVSIMVLWFVIVFGFKAGNVDDTIPFGIWLVSGMVAWNFISESICSSTSCLLEYAFLLKNIVFRPSIIPLIKIVTALVVHSFFILLLVVFCFCYGYRPSLYWIQVFYYLFCAIILIIGINLITSSFMVFIRDTNQAVIVIIQLLFWFTPIFWTYKMLPAKYLLIVKLNPFFYVIEGYREAFLYHVWFFEHFNQTIFFWIFTIVIFVIGAISFRKLQPHFMDVL